MNVREMQSNDYAAVQEVRVANGIALQSIEGWEHFANNPHLSANAALPHGWVLENAEGRIVGVHGAYPVRYAWRGRQLIAYVAHSLAVNADHRRDTLALLAPFFRQSNVEFLLTTSARKEVALLFQFMQCRKMPLAYYDELLSWIVGFRGVAEAILKRRKTRGSAVLSYPLAAAIWTGQKILGVNRRGRSSSKVRCIDRFDDRFDHLWQRLAESSHRLLAMRDRASLEWHLRFALQNQRVKILVLERGDEIDGYAILLREDSHGTQALSRFNIIDLQILEPTAKSVESLMSAALRVARKEGVDVLDVVGLEPCKRQILEKLNPHRRKMGRWPFWYKPVREVEELDMESPEVWDPTLLDGDATIWNEPWGTQ